MEKLREIATLKLIGAPDRTIIGLIVQQALLMGVVGFVAGTALVSTMKDQSGLGDGGPRAPSHGCRCSRPLR